MGFRHMLAEEFPNLEIVELREMRDDRERAYAEAVGAARPPSAILPASTISAPAITGIAPGAAGARAGAIGGLLGHELTEGTKRLLLDGTMDAVIDQNPRVEAREALNILTHAVRGLPYEGHHRGCS